jgi:autotransporter-associated beta strand protein
LNFGNVHVGGTAPTQSVAVSNPHITSAAYQDNLSASAATNNAAVTATGFAGQASDGPSQNLVFTASTATPGSLASTATLTFNSVSTVGLSGRTTYGSASVTTVGSVYTGQSTWNSTASGTWGTATAGFGTNWGTNQGSPGLDSAFTNTDTATFDNTALPAGGSATVALNGANPSLQAVNFNTSGGGYTLSGSGGGTLTLAGSGGAPATINVASGSHTISAPVALATNLNVTGSGQMTISGTIAKSGTATVALAKYGSGTLVLAGTNTYDGGTTIDGGTVSVSADGNLGTGGLTFTATGTGVLQITGSTFTSAKPVTLNGTGTFELDNTDSGSLSGNISGAGGLMKTGSGSLTLTGSNGYQGVTTVSGGTLTAGTVTSLPDGGAFDIGAGGTLVLMGDGLSNSLMPYHAASAAMVCPAVPGAADESVTVSGGFVAQPQAAAASDLPAPAGGSFNPAAVPEPGTLALLVAGAVGLLAAAWRRRKQV